MRKVTSYISATGPEGLPDAQSGDLILEGQPWVKAEQLARRIYQLGTVPMRSENHPTWDPTWRLAIERGLCAIGSGDEREMELALGEIELLAATL